MKYILPLIFTLLTGIAYAEQPPAATPATTRWIPA